MSAAAPDTTDTSTSASTEKAETSTTDATSTDTGSNETNDSSSTEASGTDTGDNASGSITDSLDLDADSTDKSSAGATAAKSGDDDGDRGASPTGAPSEYSAFEVPDGFAWTEDQGKDLTELAKGFDLTQDGAEDLFEYVTEYTSDFEKGLKDRQDKEYADYRKEELMKAKMDPDLVGPDGDQWEATQTYVRQVVTKFAGKGTIGEGHFAQMVKDGVMDTHSFLVFMKNVGRALMPDSLDLGGDPGSDTSYDELPAKDRMDWDDNAEPIKK